MEKPTENGVKVSVYLPKPLHMQAKLAATRERLSLSRFIETLVRRRFQGKGQVA